MKRGAEMEPEQRYSKEDTAEAAICKGRRRDRNNSAAALLDVCRRCFAGQWSLRQQRRALGKESEGHSKASNEDI